MNSANFIQTHYPSASVSEQALIREILATIEQEAPGRTELATEFQERFKNELLKTKVLIYALQDREPHMALMRTLTEFLDRFIQNQTHDPSNTHPEGQPKVSGPMFPTDASAMQIGRK